MAIIEDVVTISEYRCTNMGSLRFTSDIKACYHNTVVTMLPIINRTRKGWEYLYTAPKEAEKIKNLIFKDGKTVISFDLQLEAHFVLGFLQVAYDKDEN